MQLEPCAVGVEHADRQRDLAKLQYYEEAIRAALQQLPVSPTTCAAACGGSRERSAVMTLTRTRSNLSCTLLTCCGRHRGLLKRALRRMRRSCLHQLVLRLLEVDSSTTTGAEDASWLQREQQVVASSVSHNYEDHPNTKFRPVV